MLGVNSNGQVGRWRFSHMLIGDVFLLQFNTYSRTPDLNGIVIGIIFSNYPPTERLNNHPTTQPTNNHPPNQTTTQRQPTSTNLNQPTPLIATNFFAIERKPLGETIPLNFSKNDQGAYNLSADRYRSLDVSALQHFGATRRNMLRKIMATLYLGCCVGSLGSMVSKWVMTYL